MRKHVFAHYLFINYAYLNFRGKRSPLILLMPCFLVSVKLQNACNGGTI